MAFNTTAGLVYLISAQTRERLEVQFFPPSINVSRAIDLAELKIVGRNFPEYQYLSGSTEVSFELDFVAQNEDRKDVLEKCRWIESLGANDGYSRPAQDVILVFGSMFRGKRFVVKSWNYRLTRYDKEFELYPRRAVGTIVLAENPRTNLRTSQIRRV